MKSLAALLDLDRAVVLHHLSALRSVLVVYPDPKPIRTFHLSFGELLLSEKMRGKSFGVDGSATHRLLVTKWLQLLSAPTGLWENLCDLSYPGQPRREVERTVIDERLSPSFQYACRYWIHHVQVRFGFMMKTKCTCFYGNTSYIGLKL
jgi:hypothetical protein